MYLCVVVGSLASSPDPKIILEVLNFLLSSEVSEFYITVEVKTFLYKLTNYGLTGLRTLTLALFPI
jgi:hypothetical protein